MARYLVGLLCCTLGCPAFAQTNLSWKFKAGDIFFGEVKQNTFTTVTIRGLVQTQDLKQTTVSRYRVTEVRPDGMVVLERTVVNVAFENEAGLPEAQRIAQLMQGMTFQLTIDPRKGQILRLEGHEDFLQRLAKIDNSAAEAMRVMLPPEALIASLEAEFFHTPDRAVQKGDQWTTRFRMPMGPLGNLTGENKYRLEEVQGTRHRLRYTTEAKITPPGAGGAAPQGMQIGASQLEIKEAQGTVLFDAASSRVVEATQSLKFTIALKAEVKGEQVDMTLQQNSAQTIRFLDRNPLEKK